MINPITQNHYHYLSLNPFLSYAICAISTLKISLIFSKQIRFFCSDQQEVRKATKILFIALQLSAAVSSTLFPTAAAIQYVAFCVASIVLSRSLVEPATSLKPPSSIYRGTLPLQTSSPARHDRHEFLHKS